MQAEATSDSGLSRSPILIQPAKSRHFSRWFQLRSNGVICLTSFHDDNTNSAAICRRLNASLGNDRQECTQLYIFVRGSSKEGLTLTCVLRSFVPQGDHGIDFHRPARGDIAGEQCDGAQQEPGACIRQRVRRAHAEKLAG